jgi:GH25 family lysozyme M1 (1,4-beta-N-acetylmuramidase)
MECIPKTFQNGRIDMAVGVDVHCYYQRGIRWNEVTGVNYVWVKVSDGASPYLTTVNGVTYRPDTMVQGAKSRGIPVGGYHYAQPGDPRAQAELLVREVQRLGATGVLPALDIESPFHADSVARSFGEAFCNRVRELGFRPVVYMSDSFAQVLQPASWASQPVLWIARYGSKPVYTRFDVHQYMDNGSLPGAAGPVDFNDSYNDSHLNVGGGGGAVATLDNDDKNFIIDCLGHSAAGRAGGNGVNNLNGWWYNDRFEGNLNFAQVFFGMRDSVNGLKASLTALTNLVTQSEANEITQDGLAQALQGLMTAEIGPIVRQELQTALGDQQGQQATDVANAVMAKLAERLAGPTSNGTTA